MMLKHDFVAYSILLTFPAPIFNRIRVAGGGNLPPIAAER